MFMKTTFVRFTAAALLCALLTSCDDGTRTRAEGAGVGALAGGILGGVIGNQSGEATTGALIGAGIGGLAGLAYGDHVARKKEAYARTEDYLDACIAQAVAVNQEVYNYNQSLESKIRRLERDIATAKANRNDGQLRSLRREVITLTTESSQQIKRVSTEISNQQYALNEGSSASNAGQLDTQITKLKSSRNRLEGNQDRLASLGNQIDL